MPDTGDVFEAEVRPFLFDGVAEGQEHLEFTLLLGQRGAGRSRAVGKLIRQDPGTVAVLRAADLAPFQRATDGQTETRVWLAAALAYARENRISILLEDSFRSAADALAAVDLFAKAGYRTRVVVPAVSHTESLLAAAAREARRNGLVGAADDSLPAEVTEAEAIVEEVLAALPHSTVHVVLTRTGQQPATSEGRTPVEIWRTLRSEPLSGRSAAEWISELRRLTSAELERTGAASQDRYATLMALHHVALSEVVPQLPLPANSSARGQLEIRLRDELDALDRRARNAQGSVPTSAGTPLDNGGPQPGW